MVSPETYPYCFKRILDDQSNHISLFLEGVGIPVSYFLLNVLHHANHIHHFALIPFIFVLPAIIAVQILSLNYLILNLLYFVFLFLEPNLWPSFYLVSLEQFKSFHIIASPFLELFRLFDSTPPSQMYPDHRAS